MRGFFWLDGSSAVFSDWREGGTRNAAARDGLMNRERNWLGRANRVEDQQYRYAMLQPVIALAKSGIAIDHEQLILKGAEIGKAGEIGQYLGAYAFG